MPAEPVYYYGKDVPTLAVGEGTDPVAAESIASYHDERLGEVYSDLRDRYNEALDLVAQALGDGEDFDQVAFDEAARRFEHTLRMDMTEVIGELRLRAEPRQQAARDRARRDVQHYESSKWQWRGPVPAGAKVHGAQGMRVVADSDGGWLVKLDGRGYVVRAGRNVVLREAIADATLMLAPTDRDTLVEIESMILADAESYQP